MLKFSANLSMLFQEMPLLSQRFKLAKSSGFQYVEIQLPYAESVETLVEARNDASVQVALINSWPGDQGAGDNGLAAILPRKKEFKETLETSIQYAKALHCDKIHILAGRRPSCYDDDSMEETYLENLKYAANRFQKDGITGLIEPISAVAVPRYLLTDPQKALEYVKKIDHPNLKLQFDVFHVQMTHGNLTAFFKECLPYIGHVQIAQAPGRGPPDSAGEINYSYIFGLLQETGYHGHIGLEYKASGSTADSLSWMKTMNVTTQ